MVHPKEIPDIEKFEFNNKRHFIYFLLDEEEVVYVGQTSNFLNRIVSHERSDKVNKLWVDGRLQNCNPQLKKFNNIYIKHTHKDHLDHYEEKYIRIYLPKYNICNVAHKIRKELEFEKRAVDKFIIDNDLNINIERSDDKWLIHAIKKVIDLKDRL